MSLIAKQLPPARFALVVFASISRKPSGCLRHPPAVRCNRATSGPLVVSTGRIAANACTRCIDDIKTSHMMQDDSNTRVITRNGSRAKRAEGARCWEGVGDFDGFSLWLCARRLWKRAYRADQRAGRPFSCTVQYEVILELQ